MLAPEHVRYVRQVPRGRPLSKTCPVCCLSAILTLKGGVRECFGTEYRGVIPVVGAMASLTTRAAGLPANGGVARPLKGEKGSQGLETRENVNSSTIHPGPGLWTLEEMTRHDQ